MNENDLGGLWTTLEPGAVARQRIDTRVESWLEARDTSIASEWLALFRFAPISSLTLVAVSAVALITTTPLLWVARALL